MPFRRCAKCIYRPATSEQSTDLHQWYIVPHLNYPLEEVLYSLTFPQVCEPSSWGSRLTSSDIFLFPLTLVWRKMRKICYESKPSPGCSCAAVLLGTPRLPCWSEYCTLWKRRMSTRANSSCHHARSALWQSLRIRLLSWEDGSFPHQSLRAWGHDNTAHNLVRLRRGRLVANI